MKNINILYVAGPLITLFILLMMVALSFSTESEGHCSDCPSPECLCIQDVNGNWMLSPEVGDQ